eukprot:GSA25T00024551001.1
MHTKNENDFLQLSMPSVSWFKDHHQDVGLKFDSKTMTTVAEVARGGWAASVGIQKGDQLCIVGEKAVL